MAAMNLLEEYLVLHENESMGFDREASKIANVIDKKLSKTLGWSVTIFNFSSEKQTRNALYAIIFHDQKLSSLDKDTVHKLYKNLCPEENIIQDKMADFELSDEDIKQLSKEVEVMRAEMLLVQKCLWF